MQNQPYFYDGINSYLYSLVHHSGNRPNNIGNYQQPYQNNNYASIQNRYNDYVRQNIGVPQYNNFNPYENRNVNNRENEIALNNRYYSSQQSITRQQYQNPYYNPNQWRNRYPQDNNYARPQTQTRRGFQPNRHAPSRASKNRQLTRVKPHENTKQIPENNFDNNTPQNTVPSNSKNATPTENLANKNTEVDLFQIDTQADFSNLEKNSLDLAISKSSESTSADVQNPLQQKSSESTSANVVKEIISAFSNVPQESAPLEPIPNAMHKEPQQVLNVMHKESQLTFNVMHKKTPRKKRNRNKKNNKNGSKFLHNVAKSNNIQNINKVAKFLHNVAKSDDSENINKVVPKDVTTERCETVICLDSEPENEDDDIIEIPRTPIPMICLEDSDVETDNSVENVDRVETPVNTEEKPSVPENNTPACLEVKSTLDQNETACIPMDNIQNINTVSKEVEDNPTPTSKNKKRQKRKREYVENIENESQNETETSVNIEGEVNSEELQTSIISENNTEQNTTQIESNPISKNKKRTKKKRENLKNIEIESQNNVDTSMNIGDDIQKLQASILQKVLNSDQNITDIESNPSPKNKKRQKRKRDCLENVESDNQNAVETSINDSEIEHGLNKSTIDIFTIQNISTPLKDVETNPTPRTKKRPKKKRLRSTDKSITDQEQDIENKEDSITQVNCESQEISKTLTENTTEIPAQNTPTKNIEFATPKSKKRRKALNKKKNTSKLSEGSDDFLMHATDLESNQSNDSIVTNDSIISTEISKKIITVPKTLIPDIYETESSCSDIFEKDAPEQNQATTSKRPFAELDLIQFADMITTSRSKKNESSYSIVYAKSNQNCNQTTSVSFSADSSHRVIATNSTKFHFADTSSSSDESDINSKYQTQDTSKTSQNEIKNTLESNLSYQKFLCQETGEESSSSNESDIVTRIRNNQKSDKSENETRDSLSHTGDESKSQNTIKNSLVPLNNDDENGTVIDVNYEQFINQLENKIREHTDSSHDSENSTTLPNETQDLSKSSDNDSDVECITPIAPENLVISIDSDQDSIIFINNSEVKDAGDISLNVSGYAEELFNMEENQNRGTKRTSDSLNISKEEERALNLKMRFNTYWTADRELFYNRSWGGETYDHEEEQGLMSVSLKEWANPIDKMRVRRSLDSKVRCRNCRQQGHMSKNCPVPIKPCSMCGSRKHREFKCNQSCCLTCFSKFRRTFTPNCKRCMNWRNVYCKTCHNKGHIPDYCPDLWRRYHLTVKPGQIIQPKQKNQNKSTNWCSICATKGHTSDKCRYYYNILYTPPDSMQVKNYSDLYDYRQISAKRKKCNDGENNHWDIHQMKLSNENHSFLVTDPQNSTKHTTITSNILSVHKKNDTIDLISSTSTNSIELVGTVSVATESIATQPVATESISIQPVATGSIATQPVKIESIATHPVETESIATHPVETESIAIQSVANVILEHEPITSESNIKPNTTLSNEATLNATESIKTLPVCSEPFAVLPENIESNVTELNKTEPQIKSNDAENLVVETVSIESLPTATSTISKESTQIINKSDDTERIVPNPIITDSIANTPIVTESVASMRENDFAAPNNQVIIRTNMYQTATTELIPDIAISTNQSRMPDEKFDLDVPLTSREEECVYREKFIKTLTSKYRAKVYIRRTNTIKFLHITASEVHRFEIENCLREFLTVKQTASRSSHKFENLLNKIRTDYPLIEEIYNLKEPYSLYQTFTMLLKKRKKGDMEITKIVKKLNAFRKIHCQELSQRTRKYLQFLYDIYNGQNIPINLGTRAKQAYNQIFKNTTINELDEIVNEFNLKISGHNQQSTPKKSSPTKKQKAKNQKLKPIQKSTVSSTNDMKLLKYANMLEMAAGNRSRLRMIIKRCIHRYNINKEFSKKNLRSIMAVGKQLKIPFPIT